MAVLCEAHITPGGPLQVAPSYEIVERGFVETIEVCCHAAGVISFLSDNNPITGLHLKGRADNETVQQFNFRREPPNGVYCAAAREMGGRHEGGRKGEA